MEPYRHETMMMDDYDIINDIIDTMMEAYDELDGSKKYIKEAFRFKADNKTMADKLVTMSAEELGHADNLALGVESMLAKAKAEANPCYDVIHKVWTHIKERQAGYKAWIKQMHTEYKGV